MEGDVYKLGSHEYREIYRRPCQGPTCGAEIVMANDELGKWHPFDPDTGHSHYSTCPDAQKYRDKKGGRR